VGGWLSQRHFQRVGSALITGIARKLKAGPDDVDGALQLLLDRSNDLGRSLKAYIDPLDHPVVDILAESITTAARLGDRHVACQLLSIITAGMQGLNVTQRDLQERLTKVGSWGERVNGDASHRAAWGCARIQVCVDPSDGIGLRCCSL
jgi:hypothetical protein